MDGGLLIFLKYVGNLFFRGRPWPPEGRWMDAYRALPLVFAGLLTAILAAGVVLRRPPLRILTAAFAVAFVAVGQGLVRLRWVDTLEVMRCFLAHPLDEPWTTIREIAPAVIVIAASTAFLIGAKSPPGPPPEQPLEHLKRS